MSFLDRFRQAREVLPEPIEVPKLVPEPVEAEIAAELSEVCCLRLSGIGEDVLKIPMPDGEGWELDHIEATDIGQLNLFFIWVR